MDIAIGVLVGLALAYSLVTITWEVARRKYEPKAPDLLEGMQVAPPTRERPVPAPKPNRAQRRHAADA